jgi:hypothetical protein
MNASLLIVTLGIAASPWHGRSLGAETGIIYGRLMDARTCTPVPYGNVVIADTRIGAMTDWDGTYCLRNVPAGEQTIKVLCMTWQRIDRTVTVAAGDSLRVDFMLRPAWSEMVPRKPSMQAPRCPEHSTRMRFVLVSGDVYLLPARPATGESRLFGWPSFDRASGRGDAKVQWGPSCPKCIVALNNEYSERKWKGLAHRYPGSWKNYVMPGMADFMAPRGLADSVVVDSCARVGTWTRKDLRVEIYRVPPLRTVFKVNEPPAPRGEYVVFEPVGDCKATVWVTEKSRYCRLYASLSSTTNSIDNLDIKVIATGKNASKTARTILGTMLFPAPE